MHIKGDPNSDVVIIEFADYQCPACAKASQMIRDHMKKDPKKFRLAFRHFPLDMPEHPWSREAARAAEVAAKQGKFWEMHEYIFEHQNTMKRNDFTPGDFADFAADIGLDVEQFKRDWEDPAIVERITKDRAAGKRVNIESTPTFFCVTRNGIWRVRGNEALKDVLENPKHEMWRTASAGK
jgi:protein-disulfide isomerase